MLGLFESFARPIAVARSKMSSTPFVDLRAVAIGASIVRLIVIAVLAI